jgi:branched-chain amino acid transport system permease protein
MTVAPAEIGPMRVRGRLSAVWVYAALAGAIAWPVFASQYSSGLLTEIYIFAIAAMSLDLLMGYGGLVSFGHAAFFGLGAYTTVIGAMKFGLDPWISVVLGVMLSAAISFAVGAMCVRMTGVVFFMLTLAFAQLFFSVAMKWRWITGGSDGIGGMLRPSIAGLSLGDPAVMYFVGLAAFVLSLVLLRLVINSQFGHALVGLRENEGRMRALGYPVTLIKLVAFTIAGLFAGFAGALYALYNGFVSPDSLSFGLSGTFLLMVVLGGAGSLTGPAIGAGVFLLMKQIISSHTEHWLSIVGIVFICCVMFFRGGIHGLIERLRPGAG